MQYAAKCSNMQQYAICNMQQQFGGGVLAASACCLSIKCKII